MQISHWPVHCCLPAIVPLIFVFTIASAETKIPYTATAPAQSVEGPAVSLECGIASVIYFEDDGEGGVNGWSHSAEVGPDTWTLESSDSNSPVNSWRALDVDTVSDQRLVSPAIWVPSDAINPILEFYTKWDLEQQSATACYDGALLEFSTNNGISWSVFSHSRLLTSAYTGLVNSDTSNPLAGLPAWCGSNNWLKLQVDLSGYEGQTLLFRFRLGTDSSVPADDWHIDDVRVLDCDTRNIFPLSRTVSNVDGPARTFMWETSIVVGADGLPTIAFLDEPQGGIRVLKCSDILCSGGDPDNLLDATGGGSLSISIGIDGMPIVAYWAGGLLTVAKCNDPACSGQDEQITAIDGFFGNLSSGVVSMAVSSDGLPVIAYADSENWDLKVAKCNDAACTGGDEAIWVVDNSLDAVGARLDMALDSNDLPVISYSDQSNGALKVAKCNDVGCAGNDESITTVIDPSFQPRAISIVIGADGLPIISYADNSGAIGGLHIVKCDDSACVAGGEIFSSVDTGETGIWSNSIAIGSDSLPVLSYETGYPDEIRVVKCNDLACTGTGESVSVLDDDENNNGTGIDMAIGQDGFPILSYGDYASEGIKFAKCGNLFCSGVLASIRVVAEGKESVGLHSDIAIGADGNPVISYRDSSTLKIAICNDQACLGGNEVLRSIENSGLANFTSIAIGADNNPVVSFYADQQLKVAKCNDPLCFPPAVTISLVDGLTNDVGKYSSIVIADDGFPIISYFDATAGALKVAKCNDPSCSGNNENLAFVDGITGVTPNTVGRYSAIALGSDSLPVIAYLDDTLGLLKVAKCNDMPCAGINESISTPAPPTGFVPEFISIAISDDGNPVVSYQGLDAGGLHVLKCNDLACVGGDESVSNVDSYSTILYDGMSSFTGMYSSIEIGIDGLPVISYVGPLGLKLARCNDVACSGNDETILVLDSPASYAPGEAGILILPSTSLAIGDDGFPVISYHDYYAGSLKAAHCSTMTCMPNDTDSFTVYKDFVPTIANFVSVTATCPGATVINNPQDASESFPAVFQVSGAGPGTTCTAIEGSVPAGYSKNEIDCQDGDPINGSCIITNTADASLIIVKRIINDNGGTATVGAFGINTGAGTPSFDPGIPDGANTLKYISGALTVNANTPYSLTENNIADYTEGSWSCVGGDNLGGGAYNSGSVTVAPGGAKTCTITNNDSAASLIIVKRIINDNGGTAAVGAFGINTGAGTPSFGGGVADGANTLKYTSSALSVNANTPYSLTENNIVGYMEGSWSCVGGDNLGGGVYNSGTVTVAPDITKTCTITNDDAGTQLTLRKVVDNSGGGTLKANEWTLSATGSGGFNGKPTGTTLDESLAPAAVTPGVRYTLNESGPSGYSPSAWSCNGGSQSGSQITLSSGDDVTCTITNTFAATAPNAPTDLSVDTNQFLPLKMHLAWQDNSDNETQFVTERGLCGNNDTCFEPVLITQTPDPTTMGLTTGTSNGCLAEPKLAQSNTYYFRVKAMNDAGSSNWSSVVSAVTGLGADNCGSSTTTNGSIATQTYPPPPPSATVEGTTGAPISFAHPRATALDRQGRVIVADTDNHRIQICDAGSCRSFGSVGTGVGQFNRPQGVAVDHQGRIWVADTDNDRLQRCTDVGVCTVMGGAGSAPGQFLSPHGIAVDGHGRILVADTDNDRIQRCEAFGSCAVIDSSLGPFNAPQGVTAAADNHIWVADTGNDRIQGCTAQGVCTTFGALGSELGEFDTPTRMGMDSDDRMVIADTGNARVVMCSTEGICQDLGREYIEPSGVDIDDRGQVAVADSSLEVVELLCLVTVQDVFGGEGTTDGSFNSPQGVASDSTGRTILADTANHRIRVCSGNNCSSFGGLGTNLGAFHAPAGVAVDATDRIIVADTLNDRIQVCTDSGTCTAFGSTGTAAGQFDTPTGVAIDSAGRIMVADSLNNRIQVCTDTGTCSTFGGLGSATGQFDLPWGVAVDGTDQIIVTDNNNNRIQLCTDTGTCTAFGTSGSKLGEFQLPRGVAIDSKDQILISDWGNDRIQVCEASGACSAFGKMGTDTGEFTRPSGVAVDKQDRIIVADTDNHRTQTLQRCAPTERVFSGGFEE